MDNRLSSLSNNAEILQYLQNQQRQQYRPQPMNTIRADSTGEYITPQGVRQAAPAQFQSARPITLSGGRSGLVDAQGNIEIDTDQGKMFTTMAQVEQNDAEARYRQQIADMPRLKALAEIEKSNAAAAKDRADAAGGGGVVGGQKPMTADQEAKYRQKFGDAYGSTLSALQSSSDVVGLAKKLKESQGLGGISGISGYVPNYPGSESSQARQLFETLQGKITKMAKDAAAASGSLGPMAVQEWKILRDQVEAIDPTKLDEKQLKTVLDDLIIQAQNAERITEETYNATFSPDFNKYPQFANPRGALGKDTTTPPSVNKDRAAIEWANRNPQDPRAIAILKANAK